MKKLLEPIQVGPLTLTNRLVMPPVATYRATTDGHVTEQMLDYYGERAKGGNIGLIITEHAYISNQGKAKAGQLSIASDDDIEGLKKLTEVIHQGGTKVFAQINHAGSAAMREFGLTKLSASRVALPVVPPLGDGDFPEEASKDQILTITRDFTAAAVRAKQAGYDGVEIHSAHAYLLNQFYSPLTNQRTDEYGGCLENRLKFLLEVIAAVRNAVCNDYPISVRLGGCDYMEGGSTIEDSVRTAECLEKLGVNLLSVTGGMCRYTRAGHHEPGYFGDMSSKIKESVSLPVLLTGGVKQGEDAETLLEAGTADLIGVGRELLKDARWADKALGLTT